MFEKTFSFDDYGFRYGCSPRISSSFGRLFLDPRMGIFDRVCFNSPRVTAQEILVSTLLHLGSFLVNHAKEALQIENFVSRFFLKLKSGKKKKWTYRFLSFTIETRVWVDRLFASWRITERFGKFFEYVILRSLKTSRTFSLAQVRYVNRLSLDLHLIY